MARYYPDAGAQRAGLAVLAVAELPRSLKVSDRRRKHDEDRSSIDRNRRVPVRGRSAGHFGFGSAQLSAQIRFEIEDFLPDPNKFSGPF